MKSRMYKKWDTIFADENVVQQIWLRANAADIILLQRVKEKTFYELKRQLSKVYSMIPNNFPTDQRETTVICLLKATVELQETKHIRRIDNRHFAVTCKSENILYHVGVVCLDKSESPQVKRKVINTLISPTGNTPVIFGGEFGEDLTKSQNAVPKAVLNKYNGIKVPLSSRSRRTRTFLNFSIETENKSGKSVTADIFSSLPLVQNSFCDYNEWQNNPSDQTPIFQDIMLGSF